MSYKTPPVPESALQALIDHREMQALMSMMERGLVSPNEIMGNQSSLAENMLVKWLTSSDDRPAEQNAGVWDSAVKSAQRLEDLGAKWSPHFVTGDALKCILDAPDAAKMRGPELLKQLSTSIKRRGTRADYRTSDPNTVMLDTVTLPGHRSRFDHMVPSLVQLAKEGFHMTGLDSEGLTLKQAYLGGALSKNAIEPQFTEFEQELSKLGIRLPENKEAYDRVNGEPER